MEESVFVAQNFFPNLDPLAQLNEIEHRLRHGVFEELDFNGLYLHVRNRNLKEDNRQLSVLPLFAQINPLLKNLGEGVFLLCSELLELILDLFLLAQKLLVFRGDFKGNRQGLQGCFVVLETGLGAGLSEVRFQVLSVQFEGFVAVQDAFLVLLGLDEEKREVVVDVYLHFQGLF